MMFYNSKIKFLRNKAISNNFHLQWLTETFEYKSFLNTLCMCVIATMKIDYRIYIGKVWNESKNKRGNYIEVVILLININNFFSEAIFNNCYMFKMVFWRIFIISNGTKLKGLILNNSVWRGFQEFRTTVNCRKLIAKKTGTDCSPRKEFYRCIHTLVAAITKFSKRTGVRGRVHAQPRMPVAFH